MSKVCFIAPVLLLVGCSQHDDRICVIVPKVIKTSTECVHREAYLLSGADGTVTEIAQAVAARCEHMIVTGYFRGRRDNQRIMLPRTLNQLAELETAAVRRIVEARAGKCDKPK